jgi:hypothetical protein
MLGHRQCCSFRLSPNGVEKVHAFANLEIDQASQRLFIKLPLRIERRHCTAVPQPRRLFRLAIFTLSIRFGLHCLSALIFILSPILALIFKKFLLKNKEKRQKIPGLYRENGSKFPGKNKKGLREIRSPVIYRLSVSCLTCHYLIFAICARNKTIWVAPKIMNRAV